MGRKTIFCLLSVLICGLVAVSILHLRVRSGVINNIEQAKMKYQGTAEDALISLLLDESQTPIYRTHKAVWTLGQIQSEKALPVLYRFYRQEENARESCRYNHYQELCQNELEKAIHAIEQGRLVSFTGLK